MPRFFCDEILENKIIIREEEAKHLSKVLRIRPGNSLTVCDGRLTDYECVVSSVSNQIVELTIINSYPNETEPHLNVKLYQALPKGDKLEFIIQKAVELGVTQIIPVLTKYCVVKSDSQSFLSKLPRLQKIAKEAAKQSGRGIIPEVLNILTFEQALTAMQEEKAIVFYEGGGEKVSRLVHSDDTALSLLIGSEGGFSEEEIAACDKSHLQRATLGKRILRCETAPIAALSLVFSATGDM